MGIDGWLMMTRITVGTDDKNLVCFGDHGEYMAGQVRTRGLRGI